MHDQTAESAADADARFAEILLRGGVAPRHVRRSLRELRDHRADIRQQLELQGRHPLDAMHEAQLLLGHRDALAGQILARPELRSKARRFAWLVFGVLPIFVTTVLNFTVFFAALAVSGSTLDSSVHPSFISSDTPTVVHILTRWVTPFGIAMVLSSVALRRRIPPFWPVIGILLTALVSAGTWMDLHNIAIGLPPDKGRTAALACGLLIVHALGSVFSRITHRSIS